MFRGLLHEISEKGDSRAFIMEKTTNQEALAKIKVWIQKYYEDRGKGILEYEEESAKTLLIQEIEDILYRTEIPAKNVILEKFELDRKEQEEGEHFWTP